MFLPFISGSVLGTPTSLTLGVQKMAPPGSGLIHSFNDKMGEAFSGKLNKLDGLRKGAAAPGSGGSGSLSAVGGEGIGGRSTGPIV
jgi:hypothetical protein